ncbi:type II toxin-antitoxin system HicB family antitoxin [bacterium]|nr:type II toxin-antitoxin system HicB family antitoxin [bacterium]
MREITFIIHKADEGGYWAEAEECSITTQGDDLDELERMIRDAVEGYFFDQPQNRPGAICWRFSDSEVAA